VARSDEALLAIKRSEQAPQVLARLTVIGVFTSLWFVLWLARIPMPLPFLAVLLIEAMFFVVYWRTVYAIPSARGLDVAYYAMLAAEICFHTTMVYFLGGISWLGGFAYVFGLIFTNGFLDLRRGLMYTAGAAGAFAALALLDATGTIPHYQFLDQDPLRYLDPRFVATTMIGGIGVFFSIYAWVNWVGHELRRERDAAVRVRDELLAARSALQRTNVELEERVTDRTGLLTLANAALRESETLLRATIDSTTDGILVVDERGKVAHSNDQFVRMWSIPDDLLKAGDDDRLLEFVLGQLADPEAFLSKVRELYQSTDDSFDTLTFKDGRVFDRLSRPLLRDGRPTGRVWSFRDVTERKKAEAILRRQARHDPLTQSLNHAAIAGVLHDLAREGAESVAVIVADVDGMKAVNDTYGHQVGDAVLVAVANALTAAGAIVGRYGGDEFLAVLRNANRSDAERFVTAVTAALRSATILDPITGSRVPALASLGAAIYPLEAETVEDAIRLADNEMYASKRERQADGELQSRPSLAEERAAKMVGELMPLLTSPGRLEDKLRLVAHHLSAGAGYEVVRFSTDLQHPEDATTFARIDPSLVDDWNAAYADLEAAVSRPAETGRPRLLEDIGALPHLSERQRQIVANAGLRSAIVVPMVWQDETIGILSVATAASKQLDARDVQFLSSVATQVTAIIHMEALVHELRLTAERLDDARSETVVLLAAAAEAHDSMTGRHLHRVREITEALGRELGQSPVECATMGLAATLHDIGKIRVPDSILLSPAQLGDADWELMKQHTVWGADFLSERPGFELAASIARAHHERWDGSGYPFGLREDDIPEAAQIVAVADAFDAITNDRPYRNGQPAAWALREITRCRGTQFSPRVVDALLRLHAREELPGIEDGEQQAA
jgi:diguanylate cyclase (GGDEF)-like protein